jgi:hypothetical protein
MLSVDSHYLNDPLPKNIVLSPEEKARILRGGCYVDELAALNIDSKNMAQNPQLPKDYGQMIRLPIE